jgi:hypothetical protein
MENLGLKYNDVLLLPNPDQMEFAAGEEVQVDYGEGAPTRYPGTDRYRRPRLFVMTLRYSRRSFRRVVWKSSQETWARLHEQAWRYFGGAANYVALDNLKEGVIKPDLYEPALNPVYAAVLAHYGVVADPARVRDANCKGTVENGQSSTPRAPRSRAGKVRWHYRRWHVALLLDQNPSRTAALSLRLCEKAGIQLLWLPKRCPELNPIEALWRQGKDVISANKQYADIDEQVERFVGYLSALSSREVLQISGIRSEHSWLRRILSKNF